MPRNTKEKIVLTSINLFNELGLANVRLQQIADGAGISVGNLAYHFKNKEAIVSRVYEELFEDFSAILAKYLQSPELAEFDLFLGSYFHFAQKYRFYLADLMIAVGPINNNINTWNEYANKLLAQIRNRIDFYVANQMVITEPRAGIYDQLAKNIWRSLFFSIPEATFRGQIPSEAQFKQEVWEQLKPYLTRQGLESLSVLSPNI
ncbi:MAG: TetR/AcrR family transcriptional regulator [Bacteroidota bacterium]